MESVVHQKSSCHHTSLDIYITMYGLAQFLKCLPPQLWLVLSLMGLAVLHLVLQANTSLALSHTIANKVITFCVEFPSS